MKFTKMEGLGNDFIVIDGPFAPTPDQVTAWCDRRRGIGADGVLVVTAGEPIEMGYWNADGSTAEMCGNGLRCVARYARDNGLAKRDEFEVVTPVGLRPVEVHPDRVRALLGPAVVEREVVPSAGMEVRRARVGNPHAVLRVRDPDAMPVADLGPMLEDDSEFPDGANVGFLSVEAEDRVRLRVWERGVGETLACGTGAAAAVAVAHDAGWTGPRVTVELPGGELLVEVTAEGVWQEGPVRTVFSGEIA